MFYSTYFSLLVLILRFSFLTINIHLQAELGKPTILHPDKGKVSIYVDCSPTAAPMFEVGNALYLDHTEKTE